MDNNRTSILDFAAKESEVIYIDFDGNSVELYKTPTTSSIIDAVQWGLDIAVTDSPVVSDALRIMFGDLVLVKAFTNIDVDFSDADEAAVYRAYDAISQLDIIGEIYAKCNKKPVDFCVTSYNGTFHDIIDYRRSIAGIVDTLSSNADGVEKKMEDAMSIFTDPAQQEQVKKLIETAEAIQGPPMKAPEA